MAKYIEDTGKVICGAKTRSGQPCQSPPVKGRNRCRLHGGATLTGPNHGRYKHGRYSKYLPPNLLGTYQAALDDPDILSAREEIALLQARIAELSKNLFTGESGSLWSNLLKHHGDLLAGVREKNTAKIQAAIKSLGDTIAAGNANVDAWKELIETIEVKTNVQQKEIRRLQVLGNFITAQQAINMVHAMVGVVTKWINDPSVLENISVDLNRILALPEGGTICREDGKLTTSFQQMDEIRKKLGDGRQ